MLTSGQTCKELESALGEVRLRFQSSDNAHFSLECCILK